MSDVPTKEPQQLRAGDTWQWRREDLTSDYPADGGWSLTYQFKKESGSGSFTVNASADGAEFAVSVAKADTEQLGPGLWHWQAYVDDGTVRKLVSYGTLEVLPDFAASGDYDARSHVKKVLDALEAVLEGKATRDQRGMSIGTRRIDRLSPAELLEWRDRYRAAYQRELARESARQGRAKKNRILFKG